MTSEERDSRKRSSEVGPLDADVNSTWLPPVPADWQLKKLKHLGQVRSGLAKGKKHDSGTPTVELPYMRVANVQDGHIDLTDVALLEVAVDDVSRYSLAVGDVLMNEGGDYDKLGRGAVWEGKISPCLHQNHVFAVRLDDVSLAPWVSALTRTDYAKQYFKDNSKQSTNLASISQSNVKEWSVFVPPPAVRDELLAFLSVETARIDGLIDEKTKLLEYLQGMRSAAIAAAMLHGTDGDQLTEYQGAPWMGRVPSHWKRMTLTRVVESACDGPFGSSLKSDHYSDEGIPVIRLQNIGDGEFLTGDPAFISEEYFLSLGGHDAAPGDMVVASLGDARRSPGRACVVPPSLEQALVKADCFRFRLDPSTANSDFIAMQLNSLCRPFFQFTAKGTTRQRVTISDVRRCPIALPSLDEQRRVVDVVRTEQQEVANLISHVERELELLSELRAATITDAVLGRIDVREHMKN